MKNSLIKILLINIVLIFTGCQDDWLTPKPLSFYSPENAFSTPEGIDAALLRSRRGLREEYEGSFWLRINSENFWTDVAVAGSANSAQDAVLQLIPSSSPGEFVSHWYWEHAYRMIQVANLIISRIDQPIYSSESIRNALLAEAYFHRAFWFYRLVNQFGDVPYIGQEVNSPKLDFQTFTREAILQSIKKDMEFAVQWLPEKVDGGKVNRAAGNQLITKIYLQVREFDNAIVSATRIIDNNAYALMTERFGSGRFANDPQYDIMWDLYQKENIGSPLNKEAILIGPNAFGMAGNSNDNKGNMTVRNYVSNWRSVPGMLYDENRHDEQMSTIGRGVGYVAPSPFYAHDLANEDPNDLRYSKVNWQKITDYWWNNPSSPKFGQYVTMTEYHALGLDSIRNFFPFAKNKFVIPQTGERLGQFEGGFSDQYIYRLAETYLLRAEAYWWKNDFEKAAADVNAVRARAKATLKLPSDITLDYIFNERARELFGEEPRNTELTRVAYIMAQLNRNGYSLDKMHENNWYYDRVMAYNRLYQGDIIRGGWQMRIAPYNVYWPIPQNSIDANTGNIINQNKGYNGAEKNIPPKTEITVDD